MTTAITPHAPAHGALHPMASRLVDVEALPWQATRYSGIEVKTLLFDRTSGLASSLMRMAPGSELIAVSVNPNFGMTASACERKAHRDSARRTVLVSAIGSSFRKVDRPDRIYRTRTTHTGAGKQ